MSVTLQVTEKLLSACDSRKLQLIVDSYLDILHNILETSDTELQIRECVCMCVKVCGCVKVCECECVGVCERVNLFLFKCTLYSMSFHLVNSVLFVYNTLTPHTVL